MTGEVPRRNDMDRMVPAELAIRMAIQVVEYTGAHPLMTEAIGLLTRAQSKVADFVDQGA